MVDIILAVFFTALFFVGFITLTGSAIVKIFSPVASRGWVVVTGRDILGYLTFPAVGGYCFTTIEEHANVFSLESDADEWAKLTGGRVEVWSKA